MKYSEEIKKSQIVRLWDVFGLGPAMIYIGVRKGTNLNNVEKFLLTGAGALTILYNGKNYLKNRKNIIY